MKRDLVAWVLVLAVVVARILGGGGDMNLDMAVLEDGDFLYHGTDAFENITLPSGPAWFCVCRSAAQPWAGWGSQARGRRRVLKYRLTKTVRVYNTISLEQWQTLGQVVLGDTDPPIWELAAALKKAGQEGWYGKTEVMLCNPTGVLEYVSEEAVPDSVKPHGRP